MGSRHQAPAGGRGARVAEQIHHEIAALIRGELKDPRIGMVTVTGCEITPDYAYTTIHFTVFPSDAETIANTLDGLRSAAGFLRSQLGRRVRIHTTPEVRFVHDPSIERGMELSQLIDEANARRAADAEADVADDAAGPEDDDTAAEAGGSPGARCAHRAALRASASMRYCCSTSRAASPPTTR